jgi:hypothetical protein
MSAEENKALVRRAIDMANNGDPIDHLFSPEHKTYVPFRGSGPEGSTESGVPSHDIVIDDQIAAGNKVITRWTIHIRSGVNDTGDRAAGAQRMGSGITIDRVSEGKIEETWTSWHPSDFLSGQFEETWTGWNAIQSPKEPLALGEPVTTIFSGGWPRRP